MVAKHRPGRAPRVAPISRAIKVAREAADIPQTELASRLGVAQSLVGRWETTSEPSLESIVKIERVLGLPRGELLRAAGYVSDVVSVGRAVEEDPVLDERAKRVLLATYRALHAKHAAGSNGKVRARA